MERKKMILLVAFHCFVLNHLDSKPISQEANLRAVAIKAMECIIDEKIDCLISLLSRRNAILIVDDSAMTKEEIVADLKKKDFVYKRLFGDSQDVARNEPSIRRTLKKYKGKSIQIDSINEIDASGELIDISYNIEPVNIGLMQYHFFMGFIIEDGKWYINNLSLYR